MALIASYLNTPAFQKWRHLHLLLTPALKDVTATSFPDLVLKHLAKSAATANLNKKGNDIGS